jgi:hypothetical protein
LALDAAEIAAAMWMGRVTNTDYDVRLNDSRARWLFRRTLLSLANLDNLPAQSAQVAAPPSAKPRPRKPNAAKKE